eukprot:6116321-Pleurochrysis_carterae.AAC.1
MACVYILRTRDDPNKAYVGFTFDAIQRLATHNAGKGAIATCGHLWERRPERSPRRSTRAS